MPLPSLKLREGVFYGWWVVLACATIHLYLGGTFFYGFTALFNPIAEEFGWSYAIISLAFSFRGFEAGLLAPIVGIFVDRFGSRRLLLCGIVIIGLGFFFFSRIYSLWSFYAVFLIFALGFSLASSVVTMTVVARWFRKRTTLAMGLLMAGFSASGLLVPGVVWFVDQFAWRGAVVMFGVGAWLLGIPLSLVVKEPPREEYSAHEEKTYPTMNQKLTGMTGKEILRRRDFWLLSIAVLFGGVAGMAIIIHLFPYLVSVGISRQAAGFMTIAFSLSNVLGRLGFGWLGDVFDKRRCFAIAGLINGLGVLAFAFAANVVQCVSSLIVVGIGFGALMPLRPALQLELFGMKAFATVQGLLMAIVTMGGIISPPFAGWMFDQIGSYRPAFVVLAVFTLMAVPTVLSISIKDSFRFSSL